MAEQITSSAPDANGKYYFLLRRLHSLSGLFPIGVFLLFHLTANSTILAGGENFQFMVDQIHMLAKAGLLIPVELALIFVPLAFHAVFGVVIALTAAPNPGAYRYGPNIRYTLQRVTGVIAFLFVIYHVWQMHWLGGDHGGKAGDFFDPHSAPWSAATILQDAGLVASLAYVIGILSSVYHLANGIWTSLITWGITVGPRSQRMSGYACTAFGIGLGLVGLSALYGFKTYDVKAMPVDPHTEVAVQQVVNPEVDLDG